MRYPLSIKSFLAVLGAAGVGVLMGAPAMAQSAGVPEFRLSNEGFRILCVRSPLNSLCRGGGTYDSSATYQNETRSDRLTPEIDALRSPSGTTAPTQTLPSESPVPSSPGEPSPGNRGDSRFPESSNPSNTPSSSPSGNSLSAPSNTTAPTQTLPSESEVPSSPGQPAPRF
ncbi:MAG: hypothetical protein MUF49_00825 [Oculatellaceae cyanobacterium Prado106]|nr:hypothetical protein [Oculatellaceae cyanobacterium Prado106]